MLEKLQAKFDFETGIAGHADDVPSFVQSSMSAIRNGYQLREFERAQCARWLAEKSQAQKVKDQEDEIAALKAAAKKPKKK